MDSFTIKLPDVRPNNLSQALKQMWPARLGLYSIAGLLFGISRTGAQTSTATVVIMYVLIFNLAGLIAVYFKQRKQNNDLLPATTVTVNEKGIDTQTDNGGDVRFFNWPTLTEYANTANHLAINLPGKKKNNVLLFPKISLLTISFIS